MPEREWLCRCGARNASNSSNCEACMLERPRSAPIVLQPAIDGGRFPASADPHQVLPACPFCRGPLEWSGGCYRCHGTTTGRREDWTFPGVEYELIDGFWTPVQEAGRRACTPEENARGIAQVNAILTGRPAPPDDADTSAKQDARAQLARLITEQQALHPSWSERQCRGEAEHLLRRAASGTRRVASEAQSVGAILRSLPLGQALLRDHEAQPPALPPP